LLLPFLFVAGYVKQLPIDLRRTMIGNILITGGGGAGLPGFTRRLRTSLCSLFEIQGSSVGVESEVGLDPKTVGPSSGLETGPPNTETMGKSRDAVKATSESDETKAKGDRKIKLDAHRSIGRRPYACLAGLKGEVGILNDTSLGSNSDSNRRSGAGSGSGSGSGQAPAWNMGLLSWIGGSLAG
jgi:actin-related protein